MKQKAILTVAILSFFSLAVFVSATMISQPDGNYEVSINRIREGWNIIAGTVPEDAILANSEIQLSDIKAMWYYSPKSDEYIRVYPNPETTKLQQADDDIVLTSAMWIYSEKSGTLKYDTLEDYPPLENRQLFAGYNFVTITPDMKMESLSNIMGNCELQKILFFDEGWNDVTNILLNNKDNTDEDYLIADHDSNIGWGFVLQVTDNCNLGKSNNGGIAPPQIPGNDDSVTENTGLRKDIEDYYYNEFSYEECELNGAKEYTSVADCKSAWRCLAGEYANLIPESDLQDLLDYMEEHGGESGSIYYANKNPSVNSQLTTKYDTCLAGRHNDY